MLLNVSITPAMLIDMAKTHSGMQLQDMAGELGYDKTRITKLKKGSCALSPTEVKYYSDKAGLDFYETLIELETQRDPANEKFWRKRSDLIHRGTRQRRVFLCPVKVASNKRKQAECPIDSQQIDDKPPARMLPRLRLTRPTKQLRVIPVIRIFAMPHSAPLQGPSLAKNGRV